MQSKLYLLFDAGGTLVFPDPEYIIKTAQRYGINIHHQQLYHAYYKLIYELDQKARKKGHFPKNPWPQGIIVDLLNLLGIHGEKSSQLIKSVNKRHERKSLWTYTFPWVHETLKFLTLEGYRMSVISNSDGRTDIVFRYLGLRNYFEHIFDSSLLGLEKPNREIFDLVLQRLDINPEDVLYIGDICMVDIKGANSAGLKALHIDPLGLYADFSGESIPDVAHLPEWLVKFENHPSGFNLYPFVALYPMKSLKYDLSMIPQ